MSDIDLNLAHDGAPTAAHPHRFERMNRWDSLAGNIGVVLGLVTLISEVWQNAAYT